MDEQTVKLYFNMAEKPVKTLLHTYFKLFSTNNLLNICEKLQVSTKKIPEKYTEFGDFVNLIENNKIANIFLTNDSILKVPPEAGNMEFLKKDSEDIYLLSLDLVSFNKEWDDNIFSVFDEETTIKIKKYIGNIMNMVHYVFMYFKKDNSELEHIILEACVDNVTIRIKDTNFPNYDHNTRISFKLLKKL